MSTQADIVVANGALRLLGEAEITSFADGTEVSQSVAVIYPAVIDHLLACHPWRFTLAKAQLARLLAPPAAEWAQAHALPSDLIALRAVYPSAAQVPAVRDYERFEDQVWSHHIDLWAEYQRRVIPERWPPSFAMLARHALAADLAVPVAGSAGLGETFRRQAYGGLDPAGGGGLMGVARRLDAVQQPPQRIEDFPLVAARLGGWDR